MATSKLKNSGRNVVFGILKYFIGIIFPFVTRTLMIYKLGNEYTGLGSLFSSILQVLNLSELGFSTAVVYALYKPIQEKNKDEICSYLNHFRKIYRVIGFAILGIGIMICPFIPTLIQGSVPQGINIYVLYCLYLLNTSISYLFSGYKSALFVAHQRADIESKIQIVANLTSYLLQLIALYFFSNYYAYLICLLFGTILTNVLYKEVADTHYPDLKPKGTLEREKKAALYQNVTALFGHQLDAVVINAADNIVISAFLGLTMVTKYNNYYYVINALNSMILIFANSFVASIGNSAVSLSEEKNYEQFCLFDYVLSGISIISTVVLLCVYEDFIILWVGRGMVFSKDTLLLLVFHFYIRQSRRAVLTYKNATGSWKGDAIKPYISAIINLIVNITLAKTIGINGVVISTIICLGLIEAPWETIVLFRDFFHMQKQKTYFYKMFIRVFELILVGFITLSITKHLMVNNIEMLFVKAIASFVISILLFIILNIKSRDFNNTLKWARGVLKK